MSNLLTVFGVFLFFFFSSFLFFVVSLFWFPSFSQSVAFFFVLFLYLSIFLLSFHVSFVLKVLHSVSDSLFGCFFDRLVQLRFEIMPWWAWTGLRHQIQHLVSNWLQLQLQLTQAFCVLVIFLFDAHLVPLFFRLFTQVHLLIDGSVEGQYVTIIFNSDFSIFLIYTLFSLQQRLSRTY